MYGQHGDLFGTTTSSSTNALWRQRDSAQIV